MESSMNTIRDGTHQTQPHPQNVALLLLHLLIDKTYLRFLSWDGTGELSIGFTVACWETGWDVAHTDDHIIRGDTMEELQTKAVKHVKEVHGATDEQLNNPETIEKFKVAIKQE